MNDFTFSEFFSVFSRETLERMLKDLKSYSNLHPFLLKFKSKLEKYLLVSPKAPKSTPKSTLADWATADIWKKRENNHPPNTTISDWVERIKEEEKKREEDWIKKILKANQSGK